MKRFEKIIIILLTLAVLCIVAYVALDTLRPASGPTAAEPVPAPAPTATPAGELRVAFFDVGQADCILISTGSAAMLIDAGNLGQDDLILGYLADYGVTKLDYVVATHPHADHIGAMSAVIDGMEEIGTVLMPQAIATTNVFEKLLASIERRGLSITVPQPGDSYQLGEAQVAVLAPTSGPYDDLNNYSLVLRLSFGQTAFLFTGDAEALSEAEQLASAYDLSADVLKAGHHGSSSSTTEAYLTAVSPRWAVISCGRDNSYGHPHAEVLSRLKASGVTVCRTDEAGTVVFTTDGQNITVRTEQASTSAESSLLNSAAPAQAEYIGNKNSQVFHLPSCSSLPAEKNRIMFSSREDAVSQGYSPCGSCKP